LIDAIAGSRQQHFVQHYLLLFFFPDRVIVKSLAAMREAMPMTDMVKYAEELEKVHS